jgi:hypothetical protein
VRDTSGTSCRDVAEQLADDALREIVGFDFSVDGQLAETWHKTPVSADDPRNKPFMGEMVKPSRSAIPLTRAVHKSQVSRTGFHVEPSLDRGR